MGRFRSPLLLGAAAAVAVAILVVAAVYVGFQMGRNSPALSSGTAPIPSPTKALIAASPAALMPEPADFPGLYATTGTQADTLVGVPAEFETLQGVNGNRLSATLSVEIYPTTALAHDRFQHIVAFLGNSAPPLPPRQYGDESHLLWPPNQSPPQMLLHWRDRNAVADVTVSDNSRTVSLADIQAALYVIADRFSQRIAEA